MTSSSFAFQSRRGHVEDPRHPSEPVFVQARKALGRGGRPTQPPTRQSQPTPGQRHMPPPNKGRGRGQAPPTSSSDSSSQTERQRMTDSSTMHDIEEEKVAQLKKVTCPLHLPS